MCFACHVFYVQKDVWSAHMGNIMKLQTSNCSCGEITHLCNSLANEFLVAPAAESRAEWLIFSLWRLGGCLFACLLVDRELKFQLLPPGGIQCWFQFKYYHQVAYKADFKYWQQRAGATQCWQAFLLKKHTVWFAPGWLLRQFCPYRWHLNPPCQK